MQPANEVRLANGKKLNRKTQYMDKHNLITMKLTIIILTFCFFLTKLSAQTVIVTDLSVTVNKVLDFDNSDDGEIFPIFGWNRQSNNIFPSTSLDLWRSRDMPEYWINETNRLMEKQKVQNDYTPVPRKVVFRIGYELVTKEYPTYFTYVLVEGCGLLKTVWVNDLTLTDYNGLLGVFSTDIVNKECSGRYIEIKNPYEHFLTPNKRYEVGNYIIEHKAEILEKDSVFRINADGSRQVINVGWSIPANIELSITNKQNHYKPIKKLF